MTATDDSQLMQQRYLREAVLTAPPAARLTMLFDKLTFDVAQGISAVETKNWEQSNEALTNAQDIVLHLRLTLHTEVWDAAPMLAGLYNHLYLELINANVSRDIDQLRRCLEIVDQLSAAWRKAADSALPANDSKGRVPANAVG